MKATNFSLPDQNGELHTLSQYLGKWVILYFYPKDDTPGCTKEACSFRDNTDKFYEKNAVILGISKDSVESHKKFALKYKLNFPILSDFDAEVIKKYGAWGEKKFLGKTFSGILRNTYLINPRGEVEKTYHNVNPLMHSKTVFDDMEKFTKK